MNRTLAKILADLRNEELSVGESAALDNMRAVVPAKGCDPQDLVGFLETAAEIWLAHARRDKILPATFYAWYDDQAGQLRFSVVPGRAAAVSFRAPIDFVTASSEVVREALTTWTPGLVPIGELTPTAFMEPEAAETSGTPVRVWARTTEDAV